MGEFMAYNVRAKVRGYTAGAMLVINPETLRRTLSLQPSFWRWDRDDEPLGPTVADLLAGFDAKVEAAIEEAVERSCRSRRIAAETAMVRNEYTYRRAYREVLGRLPPEFQAWRPGDPAKGEPAVVARWVDKLRRFDHGW